MAYRFPDDAADFPPPNPHWGRSRIVLRREDFGGTGDPPSVEQSRADELAGLDYLITTLPVAEMALDDLLIAERDQAAAQPGGKRGFAKRVIAKMEGEIETRLNQASDAGRAGRSRRRSHARVGGRDRRGLPRRRAGARALYGGRDR